MGQHTPLTRAVFKRLYTVALVLGIMVTAVNIFAILLGVGIGQEDMAVTSAKALLAAAGGAVVSYERLQRLRVSPDSSQ